MTERKIDWRNPPLRPSDFLPWTFFSSQTMRAHLATSLWFCHSCPSLLKDIAWEEKQESASITLHFGCSQ